MTEILRFSVDQAIPNRDAVFVNQGIPAGAVVHRHIDELFNAALSIFSSTAAPLGILSEISQSAFGRVYVGEGNNELRTPVDDIVGSAVHLALFVVTLGERVSHKIGECFEEKDFALGSMLDSVASAAADRTAALAEQHCSERLSRSGYSKATTRALRYSPGYCGWHVSGQKRLFEFVWPHQIGVSLRDSFLMEPLKSVSGVIIAGPSEIHDFPMDYPFCSNCTTRGCRERTKCLGAE